MGTVHLNSPIHETFFLHSIGCSSVHDHPIASRSRPPKDHRETDNCVQGSDATGLVHSDWPSCTYFKDGLPRGGAGVPESESDEEEVVESRLRVLPTATPTPAAAVARERPPTPLTAVSHRAAELTLCGQPSFHTPAPSHSGTSVFPLSVIDQKSCYLKILSGYPKVRLGSLESWKLHLTPAVSYTNVCANRSIQGCSPLTSYLKFTSKRLILSRHVLAQEEHLMVTTRRFP